MFPMFSQFVDVVVGTIAVIGMLVFLIWGVTSDKHDEDAHVTWRYILAGLCLVVMVVMMADHQTPRPPVTTTAAPAVIK